MNKLELHPVSKPLDAVVCPPGSKSLTNRSLAMAALADGESTLTGVLHADDTRHMMDALMSFGIPVSYDQAKATAVVQGCGGQIPSGEATVFCGNSGTTIRFCTALCAVGQGTYVLDGTDRMRQRPIGPLVDAIRHLGTVVRYLGEEGYPPIEVRATGQAGGSIAFDSPPSSQLPSALMMSASRMGNDLYLTISGHVVSIPYLQMTLSVLRSFGVEAVEQLSDKIGKIVVPAPQPYRGIHYAIEPDASNASYFLAAPAIAGGRVTVRGLGTSSVQGDAKFVDVLEQMGCVIDRQETELTVTGPADGKLKGIDIDLNDMPDMVQTLAIPALFAEGSTRVRNVENLRVKETDRITAVATELRKLGAEVEEEPAGLTIHPPETVKAAEIDTYDDHRMAMGFSLAGLRASGIVIRDPGCTAKTFPDYFEHRQRMIDGLQPPVA